jgi:hypothetical protein
MLLRIAIETAHHSAAIPLVVMVSLRRSFPYQYWLVALAFSVSWFTDTMVAVLNGSHLLNHFYAGLQLALFSGAVASTWIGLVIGTFIIAVAITLSPGATSTGGYEVVVTAIGGWVATLFALDFRGRLGGDAAAMKTIVLLQGWGPYYTCGCSSTSMTGHRSCRSGMLIRR